MVLEDLDLIDRKILAYLDRDGHISYSELGKKIRVAKETVKYRILQLQKKGIIKGFYTVMDFSKLGYGIYRVYIKLQNIPPSVEEKLSLHLKNSHRVFIFFRINGPFDMVVGVLAQDIWEYQKFWRELKMKFGEYFSEYQFSVMTNYTEFSRPYLFPSPELEKIAFTALKEREDEKLADLDFELLGFIAENGRASLVSVAKKLGVSIVTARHRMKRLIEKKVIVGFRPMFNLRALGREYYKVDLRLNNFDSLDEIRGYILSNPEVTYTECSTSPSDLEFDIETKNFGDFTAIMEVLKDKFPKAIRDYSYYSLIDSYKVSYFPELSEK